MLLQSEMKPKEYSLITMARIDYPLSPERIMSELVPWFTTWGFDLDTSKSISDTISLFMESRESPRWGLLGNGVVASERHAWSAWTILRRLELHGKCVAKSPDTEFLRIVAGTRQIKEGIRSIEKERKMGNDNSESIKEFLESNSWDARMKEIWKRLDGLMQENK